MAAVAIATITPLTAEARAQTLPEAVYAQGGGQVVSTPAVRPASFSTLYSLVNFGGVHSGAIAWRTWGPASATANAIAGPISESSTGKASSYSVALRLSAPKVVRAAFGFESVKVHNVLVYTTLKVTFTGKVPQQDTRVVVFRLVPYHGGPGHTVWWHVASGRWANDGYPYDYM